MGRRITGGKKILAVFMSFVLAVSFVPGCSQPHEPSSTQSRASTADVTRDGEGGVASAEDLEALSSLIDDSATPFGAAAALAAENGFKSDDDAWARIATDALRMLDVLPASASETEKIKQTHDLLDKVDSTLDAQTGLADATADTPAAELTQRMDEVEKNLKLLKAYLNDAVAALSKDGVKVDVDSKSGKVSITGLGISSADVTRAGKETTKEGKAADANEKSASSSGAAETSEKAAEAPSTAKEDATGNAASSESAKAEESKATPASSEQEPASSSASSSADEAVSGNVAVQAYAEKLVASAREHGTGREASFADCCEALADDYRAISALLQAQGDANALASFDSAAAKTLGSDEQQLNVVERGLRLKLKAQLEESIASLALVNGDDADSNQALANEFNECAATLTAGTAINADSPGANATAEPTPEGTTASSWDELQNAVNNAESGATISLTADVLADNGKTRIEIPNDKDVTLDLNGHVLDRGFSNEGSKHDDGHVITVKGTLTVRDGAGGGRITGGNAKEGGGVFVDHDATLNLESGAIADNKATDGGGVFVESGATLTIKGGEISGNAANIGGGIVNHGTVTLADGSVSDNTASGEWAGGVFVASEATFTMAGGAVANNVNTSKDGGGICSEGTTVVKGGTLNNNNAKKSGGALRVRDGETTITGGVFAANSAVDDQGGCAYVSSGTLTLVGGTISGNTAGDAGGAIFATSDAKAPQIGGTPHVIANSAAYANDVCLANDKPFTLTGKLDAAQIGVHILGGDGVIAQNYSTFNSEDPASFFIPEAGLDLSLENGNVRIDSSWPALKTLVDEAASGAVVKLERDYTAALKDSCVEIAKDKSITIDLNGHQLNRNLGGNRLGDGHVLKVAGSLTVVDTSGTNEGKITGGNAREGGGVFVDGGVLDLQGGSIAGNKATDGGGVFVSRSGKLNVAAGGSISSNKANIGGGLVTHGETTLAGTVSANTTEGGEWGGGAFVCSEGTLSVQGATFTGNVAGKDGGAIHSEGATRIEDGTFTANKSHLSGGALRVLGGTTEIAKGTLSENLAEDKGGGIYVNNDGTLALKDVSITKNTAYEGGGGIWIGGSANVNVSSGPVVKDNTANNVFFTDGRKLTVTDTLSEKADFGIFLEHESGTFTKGLADHNKDASPDLFFTPEAGCSVQLDGNGEACIVTSDWINLQRKIDNAENGSTIILEQDWRAISSDSTLTVPEGKAVTIDLAGHTIDRALQSAVDNGEVITVNGSLSIVDSVGSGIITGGYGIGGGIHVSPTGSLDFQGGFIKGNKAGNEITRVDKLQQGGAGIRNEGIVTISGGGIGDNKARKDGGAIYNEGTLVMSGGTIGGNTSGNQGGGIYNASSGTFTLNDGVIASNSSVHAGGGVANVGTFTMTGGTVISNTTHNGGGVWSLATTTIKGGAISNNVANNGADGRGGGIYVDTGTTSIEGGAITSNRALVDGGGVWSGDTLNFTGGTVKANTATAEGGGLWIKGGSILNMQGNPAVYKNKASLGKGLLLAYTDNPDNTRINITGKIEKLARIELATKNAPYAITRGFKESGSDIRVFRYSEDDEHRFELHDDGEVYLADIKADTWVNSWDELQSAINSAQGDQVIGLKNDALGNGSDGDPIAVNGKTVTLDLNGYAIDRRVKQCVDQGSVIEVSEGSNLTIRDSVGTGVITGGNAVLGGGILIDDGATCTIEGGSIRDNWAKHHGGGICVKGGLKMTGGSIVQNHVTDGWGGGVVAYGPDTFELRNVLVSGNAAEQGCGGGVFFYARQDDGSDPIIDSCVIEENRAVDKNLYSEYARGRGGGVYVYDYRTKVIISNTDIQNNSADFNGGGIYVDVGTMEMSGGSVSDNTSPDGGGAYADDKMSMDNVRIAGNKTTEKGGGGFSNHGTSTLTNCTIVDNSSAEKGGGVYNSKVLTLRSCTISGNDAKADGGGIITEEHSASNGTILNVEACVISENTTEKSGGALRVFGDANVINSMMCSNHAAEFGGAIFMDGYSNLKLAADSITGNVGESGGGGIWTSDDKGSISIEGALTITGNAGSDVALNGGEKLTVTDQLAEGTTIGICIDSGSGTFTKGLHDKNPVTFPGDLFVAPAGQAVVADDNGEARLTKSDWSALQHMIDTTGDRATLTLTRDWKACDEDGPLHISIVKNIEIDLAGHTIDRNLGSSRGDGQIFTVQGVLTIKDSAGGGTMRGGFSEQGGGIYVDSGATFALEGGTLMENRAKLGGGIFNNEGTVTMSGGAVSGNHADEDGGGIYATGGGASGDVAIKGGDVSSNSAGNNGGGVLLAGKSSLDLAGGAVTGNVATYEAGGIHCVNEGATLSASGSPTVTGNAASMGKNILLGKDTFITLTKKLAGGAKIDITTKDAASPLTSGFQASKSDQNAFTYNEKSDLIEVKNNEATGADELFFKRPFADTWVSDWNALQNAINDEANQGKTIGLNNDIDANGADRLYVGDKTVTVELCGYKLDRQLNDDDEDGHVFEVEGNNSSLTIKDTAGTGRLTGGYAKHGGAINIHGGSVCTIEGGTVLGNRASKEGGGIFVYGTLNMTGGAIIDNHGDDCGGIYVHEDGTVTLENVMLTKNGANDYGGGAINNKGNATLKNCLVRFNSADREGGGLYNGSKQMTLVNCTIADNSAPFGGGICSYGTVSLANTKVTGNNANDSGGGAFVHGTLTASGGEFSNNRGDDCGGVFNKDGKVSLDNVKVSGNSATGHGGAGVNNKSETLLTNCEISENWASAEGGGIYNNKDLTVKNCTIKNNHAKTDGGGICSYGMTDIDDCAIKGNSAEKSGGALRVNGGRVSISGGMIAENKADEFGGGIYVNNDHATLSLAHQAGADVSSNGARRISAVNDPAALRITQNEAGYNGGGIWVASDTGTFNLNGKVGIFENKGGSNVYLTSGKKLTINGELAKGSNVGVALEDDLGTFTNNYAAFNPHDDPDEFFASDEDFRIVRSGDEVELKKWIFDPNDKQFVDRGSQVKRDYNKLNSTNWMAGLSGEKYLYEINMPGTHDSGTKSVEGNISTGNISIIAGALGAVGGLMLAPFTGAWSIFAGGFSLPVIVSEAFEKYANCQRRFIDEQLQDGIRQFDIRLNTYYAEQGYPIDNKDDDVNLWILHGKDKMGGSYFAKDDDGDFLNFAEVLSYYKDFLSRHPSETIIMSVQIDSVDIDDVYDEGVARIERHLRQLAQEVNPATNESYLYMEDGVFNRVFTHYPQLKDCRGKIVVNASAEDMKNGGFGGLNSGTGIATTYRPEGDFHDHADEKIEHLTAFYGEYAGRPLATDASTHIDYYFSVGTNGTDDSGPFSIPTVTPLEIADEVLPVMFDDPGLVVGREGTYLGLVNMDSEQARETKIVWRSNFFDGLEYCTVTAKSGLSDDDTKTYTVLKNTPLILPENIYDASAGGHEFKGWKADADDSKSKAAWSGRTFQPGATLTVSEDITFTAQWDEEQESADPANPEGQEKQDDPANPAPPANPGEPASPAAPADPTTPSDPETPSSTTEPSDSKTQDGKKESVASKTSSAPAASKSNEAQQSTSSSNAESASGSSGSTSAEAGSNASGTKDSSGENAVSSRSNAMDDSGTESKTSAATTSSSSAENAATSASIAAQGQEADGSSAPQNDQGGSWPLAVGGAVLLAGLLAATLGIRRWRTGGQFESGDPENSEPQEQEKDE